MPSLSNGILYASFTVSGKDASGNFTISATITDTSSNTNAIGNPRLSCSIDNSSWSRISPGSVLNAGASYSGSLSFSTGSTSAGTVYVYLLSDYLSGVGGSYSVTGYTPPTPTFVKRTISISPTTVTMGNDITISETAGTGVSSVTETWSAGGTTGSFSNGIWNVSPSTFEPLCPNSKSIDIRFTVYSSGSGGSGSSSATITANVPPDYLPDCSYTPTYIDPQNNGLVAGMSALSVEIFPTVAPYGNSATITNIDFDVQSTNPAITTSMFTSSNNVYTSSVLPTLSGSPSYTFKLIFTLTDSRDNVKSFETEEFRVTNFIPPYVTLDANRVSGSTATITASINSPSAPYFASLKIGNTMTSVTASDIVHVNDDYYTLTYNASGLNSGNQYNILFMYQDTNMHSYNESAYSYTRLLSTMSMPLSLYDNGVRMAISFGEECADDYGQPLVFNFAPDSYIRYTRGTTTYLEKAEDVFYSCPFPVGGIYMSADSTNPSNIWSGTTWSAIAEGRVLIGVGTGTDDNSNTMSISAGDTGGEYTHQLTIEEMPAHTHNWWPGYTESVASGSIKVREDNIRNGTATSSTGEDAYHNNVQPYLGVYIWQRTA